MLFRCYMENNCGLPPRRSEAVLKRFMDVLQKKANNSNILGQLNLEGLLTSDLEERYILNYDKCGFRDSIQFERNELCDLFYLEDLSGVPYRISMRNENGWQISSFEFQCPGCFGENAHCGVCGGSGWGVL